MRVLSTFLKSFGGQERFEVMALCAKKLLNRPCVSGLRFATVLIAPKQATPLSGQPEKGGVNFFSDAGFFVTGYLGGLVLQKKLFKLVDCFCNRFFVDIEVSHQSNGITFDCQDDPSRSHKTG